MEKISWPGPRVSVLSSLSDSDSNDSSDAPRTPRCTNDTLSSIYCAESGDDGPQKPTELGTGMLLQQYDESEEAAVEHACSPPLHIDLESLKHWREEDEKVITKPYNYVASKSGKNFRRKFMSALNVWLGIDQESFDTISHVIELLHNSSLLIDDIQDESKFRRGSLASHHVYGVAQTINAANYIYFAAEHELRKLRGPEEYENVGGYSECWTQASRVFNEELLNLHRGQGMELYWRDTLQPPTEAEYLQMVHHKTGGLFRLALRLMKCCVPARAVSLDDGDYEIDADDVSNGRSWYRPDEQALLLLDQVVDLFGVIYQIVDDYKNMKETAMTESKGCFCEDLTEGKFSFPLLHAIWSKGTIDTDNENGIKGEIIRILTTRTTDDMVKRHVVSRLEKAGSFAYTRQILDDLCKQLAALLGRIRRKNPQLEALLSVMLSNLPV